MKDAFQWRIKMSVNIKKKGIVDPKMKILSAFTGMTLQNTDEDILKNVGNQINLVTIAF